MTGKSLPARARARATRYAVAKGTYRYERDQRRQQDDAVQQIIRMGYSEARAGRAVREYATAARDTKTGPDWKGWLEMVRLAGLVD